MKRTILLLLIAAMGFNSCKFESNPTFREIQKTSNNNTLVEVNIPQAVGDDSISKTINAEIESFVSRALSLGEPMDSLSTLPLTEQIEAFNQSYKDFSNDFPNTTQEWEAQIDGEVLVVSSEIISLAITSYINTGGAHGSTNISFLNFVTSTGKLMPNHKLFKDIKAFQLIAKQHFDQSVADKSSLFEPDNFQLPANIGCTEEGIILLYNTYEIAPYASGIIEFTVPFEEVRDCLAFSL